MNIRQVYHPYKLIYHAEHYSAWEWNQWLQPTCRGKRMKTTNNSDSDIDGNNIAFDINILHVHYMFII